MTPDERQLITGLFDRMRSTDVVEKDRDAEFLINQSVRQIPDAAYMLVQSVLVQEHVLQQADQRIRELEEQVRQLESQGRPAAASGSFLGGLFGGGRPSPSAPPAQAASGSVPPVGRQSSGFGSRPMGAPSAPWSQQPAQQQPGGGGSFLRTAMMTAAGVAGGVLLADSLRGMMGGSSAAQAATPTAEQPAAEEAQHQEPQYQDPADNDPGTSDASYDSGSGDWGGGGGDMDI